MKFKFNTGISGKLMSLVIGVVALSCVSLTLISYQLIKRNLIRNSLDLMHTITEQTASLINSEIQKSFTMGETLAQMPVILDDNVDIQKKLAALEKEKNHFGCLSIGIGDPEGKVIFLEGETADVPDEDFYKRALSGEDSVSSPRHSGILNEDVITYAIPVFADAEQKTVESVIVFNMPDDEISNLLKNVKFLNTGSAYMVNEEGIITASSDKSMINSKVNLINDTNSKSFANFEKQMSSDDSGIGEYYYNGEKRIESYEKISNTG